MQRVAAKHIFRGPPLPPWKRFRLSRRQAHRYEILGHGALRLPVRRDPLWSTARQPVFALRGSVDHQLELRRSVGAPGGIQRAAPIVQLPKALDAVFTWNISGLLRCRKSGGCNHHHPDLQISWGEAIEEPRTTWKQLQTPILMDLPGHVRCA